MHVIDIPTKNIRWVKQFCLLTKYNNTWIHQYIYVCIYMYIYMYIYVYIYIYKHLVCHCFPIIQAVSLNVSNNNIDLETWALWNCHGFKIRKRAVLTKYHPDWLFLKYYASQKQMMYFQLIIFVNHNKSIKWWTCFWPIIYNIGCVPGIVNFAPDIWVRQELVGY